MNILIVTKLREAKKSATASIWLEGLKLAASFKPHESFSVIKDEEKREVRFVRDDNGDKTVSVRSARRGQSIDTPLIEVRDDEFISLFGEIGTKLRAILRDGMVVIQIHGSVTAAKERVHRFLSRIRENKPLRGGSFFTGDGIMDHAIHEGLQAVGIDSYLKVCVEQESRYVESLLANHKRDLLRSDSIVIQSGVEDVEFRKAFCLEIFSGGLPCLGASIAGKTKLKISSAEEHETAGACFFHTLNMIKESNPCVVTLENVPGYANELSFVVIRQVLQGWGYDVKATVLNGNVHGCLENRDRLCVVATDSALSEFSFSMVQPLKEKEDRVADILEPIALDDDSWRSYDYLRDKEIRDKAAGKGFKRALYCGDEESVVTIRRLYHKAGSCDPFVKHPLYEENGLTRKFTKVEHARIKGVPVFLINGLNETTAHEILGQSVCYPVFVSVGVGIGIFALLNAGIIDDYEYVPKGGDVGDNVVNLVEFETTTLVHRKRVDDVGERPLAA